MRCSQRTSFYSRQTDRVKILLNLGHISVLKKLHGFKTDTYVLFNEICIGSSPCDKGEVSNVTVFCRHILKRGKQRKK